MNTGAANDRVPQDLNRFSYVLNNPLNRVDADGYGFWKWVKKFVLKVLSSVISIVMQALFMAIFPIPLPGFGLSDAFWDTLGQMAANPFAIGADAATYASTQRNGGVGFHGYLTGARTTLFGLTAGVAAIAVGAMQGKHVGIHAESVDGQGTIVFSGVGFVVGKASAQTIGHAMLLKVERNGIRKGWNFHDWVNHESLHLQQAGVLGDGYVASHVTMGILAMMFGRELKDDQGNILRDKWHDPKINFLEDHESDSPWKWGRWP